MDQEAVTPSIGVVLMVAITLILAGAATLLVSATASDDTRPSPLIVMVRDEGADRWTIGTGTDGPQSALAILGPASVRYAWNATATSGSPLIPAGAVPLAGDRPWDAGAFLSLCGDGGAVQDVSVAFIDRHNNRVVTQTTFVDVRACAP